jgi:hypothetical protein
MFLSYKFIPYCNFYTYLKAHSCPEWKQLRYVEKYVKNILMGYWKSELLQSASNGIIIMQRVHTSNQSEAFFIALINF